MTVQIDNAERTPVPVPEGALVADRRLWLTSNGQSVDARPGQLVVEDGSPEAAFLLAAPGSIVPATEVARLGLELVGGKIVQRGTAPPVAAEPAAAPPTDIAPVTEDAPPSEAPPPPTEP